ncbi:MAG: tRNA (adenosine(37)-N6)-dimethylallyltransferase MiaA [Candidatus Magasanikbacteria bacterium]
MKNHFPKVIFIVGPTASGKTVLSILLSKKFNGEVVNADSRQVYKEMNIATAKPAHDPGRQNSGEYIFQGVAHHLVDIVKPSKRFTLSDFKDQANLAIADILSRGKLPIVVGGTGLYIWSLVDNLDIPKVEPNTKLRKSFDLKPLEELIKLLKNIDPETAKTVDLKNRRRVMRALEVAISSGESFVSQTTKSIPLYNALQIGIKTDREKLYQNINNRIDSQIQSGLVEETKILSGKYPWDLSSMSSIGYKQIGSYLRGEITLEEAVDVLKRDTRRYAKRQETWFKRDKRIVWIAPDDIVGAQKIITKFLDK